MLHSLSSDQPWSAHDLCNATHRATLHVASAFSVNAFQSSRSNYLSAFSVNALHTGTSNYITVFLANRNLNRRPVIALKSLTYFTCLITSNSLLPIAYVLHLAPNTLRPTACKQRYSIKFSKAFNSSLDANSMTVFLVNNGSSCKFNKI